MVDVLSRLTKINRSAENLLKSPASADLHDLHSSTWVPLLKTVITELEKKASYKMTGKEAAHEHNLYAEDSPSGYTPLKIQEHLLIRHPPLDSAVAGVPDKQPLASIVEGSPFKGVFGATKGDPECVENLHEGGLESS